MIEDALDFSKSLSILLNSSSIDNKTQTLFENFFGKIITVSNQEDFFDRFEKNIIDVVIIDLDEDVEEKFEYTQNLKKNFPDLIILAISQKESFDILYRCLQMGMEGYILKPINLEHFINIIKKIEYKYKKNKELEVAHQNLSLLKQYQEIADKSSIISKTDTLGNITYANDNFCTISGYTREELMGKNHNIIRHPDNPEELYKIMWETISIQKKDWSGIIKNMAKSGKPYYVKSTIKPILDTNGKILEYIALRDNISTIMNDKKHLLDQITVNDLSLLILIKIEEFDMLEKFYTIDTIDQIEKTFGYKFLSYLPKDFEFKNVYDLDNGTYALLADFNDF